jgi:hypothetical protein
MIAALIDADAQARVRYVYETAWIACWIWE